MSLPRDIRARARGDRGASIVEVVASALVLVVMGLATLELIDRSGGAAASNRNRVVASSLAHEALNSMRLRPFGEARDRTITTTRRVGAISYSVVTAAKWASDSNVELSCASTDNVARYLRVTSTVTWPQMQQARPVSASALIAPRLSDVRDGAGSVVFTVTSAKGAPLADVTVRVAGRTVLTDADGCAAFHLIKPGAYVLEYSKTGLTAPNLTSVGRQDVTVTNNATASVTGMLDVPGSAKVDAYLDDGGPTDTPAKATTLALVRGTDPLQQRPDPPADWSGTYSGGQVDERVGSASWPTLFPHDTGYRTYAGPCAKNDPNTWVSDFATGYPSAAFLVPSGGGAASGRAYVRRVAFSLAAGQSGRRMRLVLTPNSTLMGSACAGDAITLVGQADSSGRWSPTVDLPYGVYDACVEERYTNWWGGSSYNSSGTKSQLVRALPTGVAKAGMPTDNGATTKSMSMAYSGSC